MAEPENRSELLLEVRAEEMPPHRVPALARRLSSRVFEVLMGAGLPPAAMVTGYSRRRLVICCQGLPVSARTRGERQLGPPAGEAWDAHGEPREALLAFARKLEVAVSEVREVRTERGAYAAVVRPAARRATRALLAEALPRILAELPDGEAMVWGEGRGPWLRPIRGLLALFDSEPIPFSFCGVVAGVSTAGHPILSPERFTVRDGADYFEKLEARGIVVRVGERRARLAAALEARAAALGGVVDEVTAVVARMALDCEIPGLVDGAIAPEHLALPEEIVIATLAQQPGAVVLRDRDGALLPRFLTVIDRLDDPSGRVRAGYERSVYGRLADAAFLRAADRRRSLAEHAANRADLACPFGGTWADHRRRIRALAAAWLDALGAGVERPLAEQAAGLLDADLSTALVAELGLPSGMVGGLYAREDGLDEAVWQAINDQHAPAGVDDPLPRGTAGCIVALADRLLRLAAAMADATPPATRAERRSRLQLADGAVRILIEARFDLDLDLVVARTVCQLASAPLADQATRIAQLADFLRQRAARLLGVRGFSFEEVAVAGAVVGGSLGDLWGRVEALKQRRGDHLLKTLARTARRIASVAAASEPSEPATSPVDAAAPAEPAELALATAVATAREALDQALAQGRFGDALRALGPLATAVDHLFEAVLVMSDDPRQRAGRLALLRAARRQLMRAGRLQALFGAEDGARRETTARTGGEAAAGDVG